MQYTLSAPTRPLNGTIAVPASKSISNRALILAALSDGLDRLEGLADCDDTRAMIAALNSPDTHIDVGAAGTTMRFLTAFYASRPGNILLTGSERMKNRPIHVLVNALRSLGAEINYLEKEGFPPLDIRGKFLQGGSVVVDGSVSSQYLSALMMVAPGMQDGLRIQIAGSLISRPYAEMTLRMMETFGVHAHMDEGMIQIPHQSYKASSYRIEGDWSAASYWYQLLSLAPQGTLQLTGLYADSLQGDAKIAHFFEALGVATEFTQTGVRITKTHAKGPVFTANLVDQPDLAQTLAMTCALKGIPFNLSGLQSLKIKETDRIAALIQEADKLGFEFIEHKETNALVWDGSTHPQAPSIRIETYEDHRMAMAFAPAAMRFNALQINHPEVVRKSYPAFWDHLQRIGFTLNPQA